MKRWTTFLATLMAGLALVLASSVASGSVASGAAPRAEGPRTAVEGPAETKPPFDSFRVEIRSTWSGDSTITVRADGAYTFECVNLDRVPGEQRWVPSKTPYVARYRLSPGHLCELVALLERTHWLSVAHEAQPAPIADATVYELSLVRGGVETPAVRVDEVQAAGAYGDLVHFLHRLSRQEELLLAVTHSGAPGRSALSGGELDALMGDRSRTMPYAPALDYGRLVPAYGEILRNPEGRSGDDVTAGVKLMAYLGFRSQRQSLEALARGSAVDNPSYKAPPEVRSAAVAALPRLGAVQSLETLRAVAADAQVSEAVAEALLAAPRERAIPILSRMADTTPNAAWALIRLGGDAEPAILEILRRPGDEATGAMGAYNVIRQCFEHWKELPATPSPPVLAAIHDKVESVADRSCLTREYGLKLLELAGDPFVPKNARQALESYLAMAVDETQAERWKLLSEVHFRHNPPGAFPTDARSGKLRVAQVYESRPENAAWARVTGGAGGLDYAVLLGLSGGLIWEIAYAGELPGERVERERARFLAAHPDAQELAAGAGEVTPDTLARNENAVRQMAPRFMKAMRDGDVESLKAWSIGSSLGWVTPEDAARLGRNPPVGWSVAGLEKAVREFREEVYARNPAAMQDVVEVLAKGNHAAVHVSGPNGRTDAQHLIVVFQRTDKGWRMVDMDDSSDTLARESESRMAAAMRFHAELLALRQIQAREEAIARQRTAAQAANLHEAASMGNKAEVERLLAGGADVNARGTGDRTPLHQAAQRGNLEIAQLLLARGAETNAADDRGLTPLHMAVQAGQQAVVEALIAAGADVNATDFEGRTPTGLAIRAGRADLVDLLVRNGGVE